jgi:hypothetical protein
VFLGGDDTPIGNLAKWNRVTLSNLTIRDVAAAWIDGNTNKGDASTCANRSIEGTVQSFEWSGQASGVEAAAPETGDSLFMYCGANTPHVRLVTVKKVDTSQLSNDSGCTGSTVVHINQVSYTGPSGTAQGGCSGAPILTSDGKIVAMHLWGSLDGTIGGGLYAPYIKQELGFLKWYGTATFPNNAQVCQ